MKDDRHLLKIKIKHLAAEARIIRHEERKHRGMDRWRLQEHRRTAVRSAARRTQLAYAYIRGRTLEQVAAGWQMPGWMRRNEAKDVHRMIVQYGKIDCAVEDIERWLTAN